MHNKMLLVTVTFLFFPDFGDEFDTTVNVDDGRDFTRAVSYTHLSFWKSLLFWQWSVLTTHEMWQRIVVAAVGLCCGYTEIF